VERVNPEMLHELEHVAQEKLHDLKQEIQEHNPFTHARREEQKKRVETKRSETDGD
jgi:hypothetical protein